MQYGLIGEKLGHSYSKEIHEKIGRYGYELKEIPRDNLASFFQKKDRHTQKFKGLMLLRSRPDMVHRLLPYRSPDFSIKCIIT